jgi:hypothetical protein
MGLGAAALPQNLRRRECGSAKVASLPEPGQLGSGRTVSEFRTGEAKPGFFLARWRGLIPLDRVFWRDMALVGTGFNLATSAAAIAMLGVKMPLGAVLAVHFLPVPYNVFLFLVVWRTAAAQPGPLAPAAQIAAATWLVLATVM